MLKEFDLHYLTEAERREMFRPAFIVTCRNGEVRHINNIYFSDALATYHGEKVQISVDIHNANSVIVRNLDGVYICEAIWNGNKREAFPVSMVDDAREKRADRREANVERKLEQIEAERHPHRTIEHAPDFRQLGGVVVDAEFEEVEDEPLFYFPSERQKWLEQQKRKSDNAFKSF